jgi:signal transduction histidine kinase
MILAIAAGAASLLSFIAAHLARPRRKFVLAGIVASLLALLVSLPHLGAVGLNAVQIAIVERLLLVALIYAMGSWLWAAAGGGRLTPRMLAGAIIISIAASISALGLAAANPVIAWWLTTAGLVLAALFLAALVVHRAREVLAMPPGKAGLTLTAAALLLAAVFPALGLVPETGLLVAEFIYRLLFLSFFAVLLAAAGRRIFLETRQHLASGFDQAALIAAQREEIAEKTSALAQEERRRAILEERQRLLRDMHDGVGGQLVSLLVRIRSNNLPKKEIEADLRSGLTDLRLIVDSLDTAGDSLPGALMAFHDRAAPQAEAAGIELEWQQSEVPDTRISEPRALLNLYRWMQEALANAIRHANASRVRISVNASDAHLTVTIEDDGFGLPQDVLDGHRSGKGLKSMQARAREMGGESVCTSANLPSGTRCEIRLPLAAFGLT